ncbi:VanZ family protein [Pleionea sp. CnH1-48]|uniref:VanZ family protein n=1 Tax=Pleionea sp. CnH1-48 TaxID=2954494 RepID=UPI0020978977|nr:VanZ family protein [Pleionea sp. CnH1-48]MCO7224526.1 VanZ family protein [Pleionea sp. CnH1-48]
MLAYSSTTHGWRQPQTYWPKEPLFMRFVFFIIIVLISYGSLFPFEFTGRDLSQFDWATWLATWDHHTTRGDILGNILLFIPFGLFGTLSYHSEYKRYRWAWSAALLLFGFAFALTLQMIQVYLPSRVAAVGDVWFNMAGLLLGMLVARLILSSTLARWFEHDQLLVHVSVPLMICFCWLGYLLFPFIPSFDWGQMKDSVKPLFMWQRLSWFAVLDGLVAWCIFWLLLKQVLPGFSRFYHRWLIFFVISLLEVAIVRNVMSLSSIIAAGVSISLMMWVERLSWRSLTVVVFGWLFVRGLHPFTLNHSRYSFSWVPFSGFLRGSMWYNSYVLFEKLFFFGAAYYFLNQWLSHKVKTILCLGGCLLLVEVMQMWVGNHYPEITDPLLALLFAVGLAHLEFNSQHLARYSNNVTSV